MFFYIEITPRVERIELTKIIINPGTTIYFMQKIYAFLRLNLELYSTSSITVLKPVTFMINKHVHAAEIGIIIEFVIKSKKSRILIPSGVMKSNNPNPSEHGIPRIHIPAKMILQHFFLDRLKRS